MSAWFRGGPRRNDAHALNSMSARLRGLRERLNLGDDPEPPESQEAAPARQVEAELLYIAGPRAGERVLLQGERVALDRDANEMTDSISAEPVASIWAQGEHFMLRHSSGVLVGGQRPTLPVIALEDGDELAWGNHRLQFRMEEPRPTA